jgi:serine/threonine-protein kinase
MGDGTQELLASGAVDMPQVLGKSQGAALEAVSNVGLHPRVIYDYSDTVRKGSVMAQHPAAGVTVSPKLESLLLISSGPALNERLPVPLPSVVGMTEGAAALELRAVRLSAQFVHEKSATVPAGHVSAQIPDRDSLVTRPKTKAWVAWLVIAVIVALLAAVGVPMLLRGGSLSAIEQAKQVTVPEVVGLSLQKATTALEEAGLKVGTVTEVKAKSGVKAGAVVSATPEAGQEIAAGSSVALEVAAAKGSDTPTVTPAPDGELQVPDVTGLDEAAARSALRAMGLSVDAVNSPSSEVKKGLVIAQSPMPDMVAVAKSSVVLVVSSGKPTYDTTVTLPEVVGLPAGDATAKVTALGLVVKIAPENVTGSVINQIPAANSKVLANSVVLLEVQ